MLCARHTAKSQEYSNSDDRTCVTGNHQLSGTEMNEQLPLTFVWLKAEQDHSKKHSTPIVVINMLCSPYQMQADIWVLKPSYAHRNMNTLYSH